MIGNKGLQNPFFLLLTIVNVCAYYIDMHKTFEEIRHDNDMNQIDFAKAIGIVVRTYQKRLKGERQWHVADVIRASQFNDGDILIELPTGERWCVTCRKCDD